METETVHNIWRHTRCMDLLKGQHMIEIDSEVSVPEACQILVKNGISSAPVYNSKLGSYVGMLDYRDIVDYVLLVFRKKTLEPISEEESVEISDIVMKAQTGQKVSCEAVSDLSRKNPFYSVMEESPLDAAIDILAADNGVHRINVVGADGRVKGLLSQTDIIRFLVSRQELFKDLMNQTLEELELGRGPVLSVTSEESVLEALERMSEYNISSIAVIETSGTLLGNISMADIRFIFQHGRYHRLWMTCANFVSMALSQKGLENLGKDRYPVFDIRRNCTLGRAICKLLATKVHRLWVTDEHVNLIGVVSVTDIIRTVVNKLVVPERAEEEDKMRAGLGEGNADEDY